MSWGTLTSARTRFAATMLTSLAVVATACSSQEPPEQAADTAPSASASPSATTTQSEAPSKAGSEQPNGSGATASGSASGAPEESPSAAASASPDEPSTASRAPGDRGAAVQAPPPGAGPKAMLLRPSEMPGLNVQHSWRPIATEHRERRRPVWSCQVTDFLSIGATDVWVRRFVGRPGGGASARARSAVITFVDNKSAQRAHAVLRAWHDRCEEQLDRFRRVSVDAAGTPVAVRNGMAEWRMAVYAPVPGQRDASYFDATGYVRKGRRISLTTMVNVGQDYNYPSGREPIVRAVRASAVKLRG
jgi:hypothetical protein